MDSKNQVYVAVGFIKSTMPLQREPYAPFAVVLKPSTCFPISGAQTCFMIPNLLYVLLLVMLEKKICTNAIWSIFHENC